MGLTHIRARISNPARPRAFAMVRFLVDSGAIYSVIPAAKLKRLGIAPHSSRTFILADGTEIRRRLGDATFRIGKHFGTSTVIFGEKDDASLIGMVSLESRELRPLPMILGGQPRPRS